MRVVFMGTPEFAVPTLERLHEQGHSLLAVVTQPDRPAGRGRRLTPSPVKERALKLALPVHQPEKIKSEEAYILLRETAPEVIVVVGYGQIIPRRVLELPPLGCINVHSSLLPKYRGAAPVNWAIARGETMTGVTTMRLIFELDAGPILLQRSTPIGADESAPEVLARLAPLGADLLVETLEGLARGAIEPREQNHAEATFAPILKREDGQIDWSLSAAEIANRVRGFDPWPGAYTAFRGKRLRIRRAHAIDGRADAGRIEAAAGAIRIGCGGGGLLEALELQLEGRNRIAAAEFIRGYQPDGERLGELPKEGASAR